MNIVTAYAIEGCLQSATDGYTNDTNDSTESETDSIEVVPLPVVRKDKTCKFPVYRRHGPFTNRTLGRGTAINIKFTSVDFHFKLFVLF